MAKRRRQNYAPAVCMGAIVLVFSAAVLLGKLLGDGPSRPTGGDPAPAIAQGALPGAEEGDWGGFESGVFYYRLSGRPYFKESGAPGVIMAENPDANLYDMQLVYLLEDTGEVVYESPLVPPGSHIAEDALLAPLEKGVHPALALIYALDETGEVVAEFEEPIDLFVGRKPD